MRRILGLLLLVVVATVAIAVAFSRSERASEGPLAELHRLALDRGRVVWLGDDAGRARFSDLELVSGESLGAALGGHDEAALRARMTERGIGALIVGRRTSAPTGDVSSLAARFTRYDAFDSFSCLYLTSELAIYVPRAALALPPILSEALAHVARSVVGGEAGPRVQSFPEPLRRIQNVEVMVLLSEGGRPRLWRSARGSSVARALLTAATVARQRWNERETAMGGKLSDVLPRLDVSVFVLEDDGTLGERTPAFIDAAFQPAHGVAFEHRGNWHYLLPEATRERGEGSAMRAYAALLQDQDMPETSLERREVRLYRSAARLLATSPAPARSEPARGAASDSAGSPAAGASGTDGVGTDAL